ncbi:LuxR C-terminal-related transcriptional regulator [Streptomyces sp. NPDC048623]|uniref:ATP-binding protein n=1 Tax=Streptomyces sp. NPDC048623 TaxID=3155761 RepID=UPI0034296583
MSAVSAVSGRGKAGNLPADVTSFVGRRREISEALRLLSSSRLLTLTGPGGVGKTRLALRVADRARRNHRDGVWLVELADVTDPSFLAHTTAERLGLQSEPSRESADLVIDHLAPREALLVLDNCEHLVDECAAFVAALLAACPRLTVLATSRQSLGVYGESTLVVPPLPVPDPDRQLTAAELFQYDSVTLFVERARAVLPGFEVSDDTSPDVLARLCRDLDGIPLAIELAAVWLRTLSLGRLEERLSERYRLLTTGPRSAPTRQRTLRALIDWSHELCSRPEQLLWARASVFTGGFDLPAVEYVGDGDGVSPEELPDLVHSLVDKSVLIREEHHGEVRYRMLETLREYGLERLAAAGEETAVRRRHRDWYAGLIERFDAEWIGPGQKAWLDRLEHEHANLRAALAHCLARPGEAVVALRMATGIDEYWSIRGLNTEARYWLDQALAAAPEPGRERISALCLNAWYALLQSDAASAQPLLDEAEALIAPAGGPGQAAFVAHVRGMAALFAGDLDRAAALLDTALAGFRAGRPRGELFALSMLGLTEGLRGDRARGLGHIEEGLALAQERGEEYWRSWALWSLAFLELDHDLDRAEAAAKEALAVHGRMESQLGTAFLVDLLGWVSARQGRDVRAATLFGAAAAVWHPMGTTLDGFAPMAAVHDEHLAKVRAALGDERYETSFAHGNAMTARRVVEYALEDREKPSRRGTKDADDGTAAPLTPRERQVAALLTEGLSNKEIAARLVVSTRTAETHVDHILSKLGFTSRAQAAAWATGQDLTLPAED